MIDRLIGFSIRNKLVIGFFVLLLVGWGAYSLSRLPIDAVPDITNNQVQIITLSPTLAAQEVEQFITYPVETSVSNIPNVIEVRSISRFGLSVVTVVFKDDVDIYLGRQLAGESIKAAQEQIPAGLGTPEMAPVSTGLGEVYQYLLHTKPGYEKKYSAMDLRTMQDWIVKRQLAGTPGVAEVSSLGGYLKEYEVSIHPEKLIGMNTTLQEIFKALEQNNENTGGAYIEKAHNAYFIRGIGLIKSLEDVGRIVVKNVNGVPLLIRDVAEVGYGNAVRYGAITRNGEGEVVGGIVLMLKGANATEVIENVKERMATIQKSLPEGVVIEPFLERSKLVNKAISTVSRNLIEGGLIVILILVLLLGNFRAGLVVASVIPLAMLFAIAMMNLFGISGNLMSLGAIDFGLIVDGAVIIVESIVHRIHHGRRFQGVERLSQQQMDDTVYDASTKIRQSAAFGEIIILMVYLPILTLVGIEGKMFKPMAQVVCFAILGALILSLTYVPMMSALFLSKKPQNKVTLADRIMGFLQRRYDPIILYALKHKATIIISSIALFIVSLVIFMRMGGEFIPTLEEGDFAVESAIAPGSSLAQSIETFSKAEKILLKQFPEVIEVVTKIGTGEIPTDPMPIESGDMMVILKDKSDWTSADSREELAEKMEAALSVLPGARFEFQQPIQMRFNELMTGVKSDVAVKIYGEDMDVLLEKAKEAEAVINGIEGAADVRTEQVKGLPQIIVNYKRDKIAQYGLNISEVNSVVRTAFAGEVAGVVYEGEKRFNLVVRLEQGHRKELEDVKNLYVTLPSGAQIPLYEIAEVGFKEGAMQIARDNAKRRITIALNVRNRDVESLVEEVQQKLESKVKLPPGYYFAYGGQFENLKAAKDRLMIAVPVALAIILILLFFTFGSMKQSLLIFTAIPLAAIGGVFALLLRGMPFSISAGIGFIALFGVAVLNGIVLIGYFNQLQKEGITDLRERILTGTRVRLRPVIMTAAVASLGFLPMALSSSEGAEVQKPLATVVIGGLVTSTLLTLILLPVLYSIFEKNRNKESGNGTGKQVIVTLLLLIGLPLLAQAQNKQPRSVTIDEAVSIVLVNSPGVKTAALELEQQKALKGTSFDLDKTNVSVEYGQINSPENDNAVSVSQDFSFPTVYTKSANLTRQQIKSTEYRVALSKNEMARNVKSIYYQLLSAIEQQKLLKYQDSLYSNFQRAAELKYTTGETAYLEKIAAEAQLMEVRNTAAQVEAEVAMYKNQLRRMLGITEDIVVVPVPAYSLSVQADTSVLNKNPYLAYLNQQVAINNAQVKLEKAKLLPDFSIGYTSQTISGPEGGAGRFNYVQAGVGIPLFFGAQRSRIQAAKIGEQIAASDYEYKKQQLETELQLQVQEYLKLKNSAAYYEQKAIPQANLMIEYAQKSYDAGEIGYMEYLQNVSGAISIKLKALETLNQLNLTIITLDYILGGTN
jgi:cobalt-zinc-cadmium resistance protein CzcA